MIDNCTINAIPFGAQVKNVAFIQTYQDYYALFFLSDFFELLYEYVYQCYLMYRKNLEQGTNFAPLREHLKKCCCFAKM